MLPQAKARATGRVKLEVANMTRAAAPSPPPATVVALPPAWTVPPPPPPFVSGRVGGPVEYSALPPLPAPLPAASSVMIAASAPPPLPAPRLTLRCLATNTVSAEGPCDPLERNMVLTVRADEDVA